MVPANRRPLPSLTRMQQNIRPNLVEVPLDKSTQQRHSAVQRHHAGIRSTAACRPVHPRPRRYSRCGYHLRGSATSRRWMSVFQITA